MDYGTPLLIHQRIIADGNGGDHADALEKRQIMLPVSAGLD
jgi:hypothetical protein